MTRPILENSNAQIQFCFQFFLRNF
jgi:hypothetical protein